MFDETLLTSPEEQAVFAAWKTRNGTEEDLCAALNALPVTCGACNETVPGEFVIGRPKKAGQWWPQRFAEYPYVCLRCIDHGICYPNLEMWLLDNDKIHYALLSPTEKSTARAALKATPHKCCISEQLRKLEAFTITN